MGTCHVTYLPIARLTTFRMAYNVKLLPRLLILLAWIPKCYTCLGIPKCYTYMCQLFIVGVSNKWLQLRLVSMLCHIICMFCIILNNGETLILLTPPPDLHTLHEQLVFSSIMCVLPTDSTPCKCLYIQFSEADSSGIHCLISHD